ncbi:zinc-binding protein A33-like [Scyliorhinus canicula]|uniref:zinc-binding protein A33-like n=1 Tax=Scyliorhinus canicula TaxID=7830 RepID=UPI0018F5DC2A|nr:zinc-binding protein A33-like [Scyliorhinus canicula]
MAASEKAVSLSENLLCPICLQLLVDASTLECGHSYCQPCINQFWDKQQPRVSCPECRAEFPDRRTKAVHALRNAVEQVRESQAPGGEEEEEEEGGRCCPRHGAQYSHYCQSEQALLCALCQEGGQYQQHLVSTIAASVTLHKDALKESLEKLNEEETTLIEVRHEQKRNITAVQEAFLTDLRHVKQCFAEIGQLIERKEQSLVEKLEGNVETDMKRMETRLGEIQEGLTSVGVEIVKRKEQLAEQDDIQFLQGLNLLKQRTPGDFKALKDISDDPPLEVLKGPVQYSVWKELRALIKPGPASLTLDPVTASPWLVLSEDLTSVAQGNQKRPLPDDPQRFDVCPCVLASVAFTSGRHYWEVNVGRKSSWTLGVAGESVSRKGEILLTPPNGYWVMGLRNGSKYTAFTLTMSNLQLDVKPRVIGVYLDCEGGQVSFYNADAMSHLHTFRGTFTQKLYPFFSPGLNQGGRNAEPLQLCHSTVSNPITEEEEEEEQISPCLACEREDATSSVPLASANSFHWDWSMWKRAWLCFGVLVLLGVASPGSANFAEMYLVCCGMLGSAGWLWALLGKRSLAGVSWLSSGLLGYAGLSCLLLAYARLLGACLLGLSLVGLLLASSGRPWPFWVVPNLGALAGLVWLSDYEVWVWWVCCGLLAHAGLCLSLLGYANVAEVCWWCGGVKGYVGLCLLLLSFHQLAGVCWVGLGLMGLCLSLMGHLGNRSIMAGLLGYSGVWCALVGDAELSAVTLGVAGLSWSCWSYYAC